MFWALYSVFRIWVSSILSCLWVLIENRIWRQEINKTRYKNQVSANTTCKHQTHWKKWLPVTLTNSRVMQGGSRWPKSLFVSLAGQSWGGKHCWRHSEDKARHSPGHAWATQLAPDLHTVHTPASGPTGSHTCTHTHITSSQIHTEAVDVKRGQGLTMGKSIQFIIGGSYRRKKRTITNLHKGAWG